MYLCWTVRHVFNDIFWHVRMALRIWMICSVLYKGSELEVSPAAKEISRICRMDGRQQGSGGVIRPRTYQVALLRISQLVDNTRVQKNRDRIIKDARYLWVPCSTRCPEGFWSALFQTCLSVGLYCTKCIASCILHGWIPIQIQYDPQFACRLSTLSSLPRSPYPNLGTTISAMEFLTDKPQLDSYSQGRDQCV